MLSRDVVSLAWAGVILGAWAAHLSWWLSHPLPWWGIPVAVAVQTWLYTGLFIVAHDAIHGSLCRSVPALNTIIGQLCTGLYAAFPYRHLEALHHQHHDRVGSAEDPDGPGHGSAGWMAWYLRFVRAYIRWPQIVVMAIVFNLAHHGLGASQTALLALWVVPSLLSTVQLFTIGTWLPHRPPFADGGHTRTLSWPVPLAFVGCYFFGYHEAHHERPDLSWWELWRYRQWPSSSSLRNQRLSSR